MRKSEAESTEIIKAKKKLGKKIAHLRKSKKETISLRDLATWVGLPPSNMKYIEDGINAPTAKVYDAIIQKLEPSDKIHAEMDQLYTIIRGTPPPDVCNIVIKNSGMNDALRIIQNQKLSDQQMALLQDLLMSFKAEATEGEN